ncbi:hypothetical protein H8356DRAFT_1344911 [Neocallimastix lanati (nom. inval.)]|nr:hypothetical protein H8356DRAFT_1344911 [Neocallimastix sp. JGI-2020a]
MKIKNLNYDLYKKIKIALKIEKNHTASVPSLGDESGKRIINLCINNQNIFKICHNDINKRYIIKDEKQNAPYDSLILKERRFKKKIFRKYFSSTNIINDNNFTIWIFDSGASRITNITIKTIGFDNGKELKEIITFIPYVKKIQNGETKKFNEVHNQQYKLHGSRKEWIQIHLVDNSYFHLVSSKTYSLWNQYKYSEVNVHIFTKKLSLQVRHVFSEVFTWLQNHINHPSILPGYFNMSTSHLQKKLTDSNLDSNRIPLSFNSWNGDFPKLWNNSYDYFYSKKKEIHKIMLMEHYPYHFSNKKIVDQGYLHLLFFFNFDKCCCGGLFEDDIVLCAPTRSQIKKLLKLTNKWTRNNEMKFISIFLNSNSVFYLSIQQLLKTNCSTYLGVTFSKNKK